MISKQDGIPAGLYLPENKIFFGLTKENKMGKLCLNMDAVSRIYCSKYVSDIGTGRIYYFDGIGYVPIEVDEIMNKIFKDARKEGLQVMTPAERSSIKSMLEIYTLTSSLRPLPTNMILFKNGVMDLNRSEDDENYIRRNGDSDYFTTSRLNVSLDDMEVYDRNPDIEPYGAEYLRKMIGSDESMKVLFECIGCFLYDRRRRFSPMLYIYGKEGGSGKSNLGNVLKRILGDRMSMAPLPNKDNSFNMAYAYKDLIFVDEVTRGHLNDNALNELKRLTSANDYCVTPKGKDSFDIRQEDKPMVYMTSNSRPDFETDGGINRRLHIIRVEDGVSIDDTNYNAWQTDDFCSWIAWKGLKGYKDALKRGYIYKDSTTTSILDTSFESPLRSYLDSKGYDSKETARAYLMQRPAPIYQSDLIQEVKDFEMYAWGRDAAHVRTSSRTIKNELDAYYSLEWYKQSKIYRDIKQKGE